MDTSNANTGPDDELQRNPELLRSLLDISGQLIVVLDAQGRIVLFNRACEQATGFLAEDLVGKTIWEYLIPEDEFDDVATIAERLSAGQEEIEHTNYWLTRGGERRLIRWRNTTLTDQRSDRLYLVATGIDITEQQRAVRAQHHTRSELRNLLDALPVLIAHIDRNYHVRFVNHGYREWFDLDPDTLLGRHVGEIIGTRAFATLKPAFDRALSGKKAVHHGEVPYARKGSRFIHGTYIPSCSDPDHVDGLYILAVDLTEQYRLRWQLAEELRRSQTIVDNAIDGIITIDRHGVVRDFNPAAEHIFGYNKSEIIGQNVRVLMPEPDSSRHDDYIRRYLETGQARIIGIGREVTGRHRDGSPIDLRLAVAEVNERDHFFIGFTRDIRARKRAEREAREHFAELAHVTRLGALGEVTSGLAHELSQPLTAIAASVEASLMMISSGQAEPEALKPALEQISRQGQRAREIIEQLRAFLRKGQPDHMAPCSPARLVDNVLKLLNFETEDAGVDVEVKIDSALHSWVVNRIQIEQVLFNLAKNAIDAMRETEGERRLTIRGRAANGWCELAVIDTGPGIADEHLKKLFSPFFTTKSNGLGQGLSICRSIIQRHGGELTADSRSEGGAVFRFVVPMHQDDDG